MIWLNNVSNEIIEAHILEKITDATQNILVLEPTVQQDDLAQVVEENVKQLMDVVGNGFNYTQIFDVEANVSV